MNHEYWIWLVLVFGAGNPKIWKLLEEAETPQKAVSLLQDGAVQDRLQLTAYQKRAARSVTLEQALQVLERCERLGISVVCYGDGEYPTRMLEIYNPPCVLFYQGKLSILEEYPAVTVVGTRTPTPYSVHVTDQICRDLAKVGVVIVSGFALGIDSAAHRAALLAKGRTVAVFGCGLDVDYPKGNAASKQYIRQQGLLLTEFLPGTEPHPKNFPLRNRILSGISLGTLVVQAPERSGSLITAALALEQGRNVFCIPPADIFDKQYAGVVKYLRDGAIPVFSYLDIVNEYYNTYAHKLFASVLFDQQHRVEDSPLFAESHDEGKKSAQRKKAKSQPASGAASESEPDAAAPEPQTATEPPADTGHNTASAEDEAPAAAPSKVPQPEPIRDFSSLEGLSLAVMVLLSQEHQMHIDAIAERLDAEDDELAGVLTELSIAGYIQRFSGQNYRIL